MTIPDTNVLINAVNDQSRHYPVAKNWLVNALSGTEPVGFSWVVLLGFARITTRAGIWPKPMSITQSFGMLETWLAEPAAEILNPGTIHTQTLKRLLSVIGTAGNLVPDAHLAALAIEHGAELVTFDRDFGRFAGLRWKLLQ